MTPEQLKQIKKQFENEGRSFSDWAREHDFPVNEVYKVINGMNKAKRGRGHLIAVALGLKKAS